MSALSLLLLAQLSAAPAATAATTPTPGANVERVAPAKPLDTPPLIIDQNPVVKPVEPAATASPPPTAESAATAVGKPGPPSTPAETPADEEPEPSEEVDSESAELEEVKALEEKALSPQARPAGRVNQAVSRLGIASPVRARMQDAFESSLLRDDSAYELGLVTNLADFDVSRISSRYDIPVEMQPLVAQYIEFFQGAGRKWFRKWMSRSRRFIPILSPILEREGVPKDLVYLAMIESGFSTQAYSRARAAGMWQFIASTGKRFGLHQDFWVDERRDYEKSTVAAAHYLHELKQQLGHWYLAWAGYNAGGGRVQRAIDRTGSRDFWQLSSGKGLAKETQHYVPKLIAAALVAKHPQSFGFQDNEFDKLEPLEHEQVELVDPVDLEVIARAAHCTQDEVRDLNPELKRWCTPPASKAHPYILRLPKGTAATFAENFPKIAPKERLTFVVHVIQRGDTLSQIARRYHSAPEPILQLNHLTSAKRLRLNSELVIPVPRGQGEASLALEHSVEKARKQGYVATRPEEEVPAGAPKSVASNPGEVVTQQVEGKTQVTYTIQDGDNLWSIGQRFHVGIEQLRKWNAMKPKSKLQIGAKIIAYPEAGTVVASTPAPAPARIATTTPAPAVAVPKPAAAASAAVVAASGPRPKTHVLEPGETLWSLSQKYGVPLEDLKRWNRVKHAKNLQAGQQISLMAP